MSLLGRLLKIKKKADAKLKVEEYAELMCDKGLEKYNDRVVNIVYSRNKLSRFVLLSTENGLFRGELEQLKEDKLSPPDAPLPVCWEPVFPRHHVSYYESEKLALDEFRASPEYIRYFL